MQHRLARWLVAATAFFALALSMPAVTTATVSGGCVVTGTSSSGTIDITTEPVWHLKSTDSASGSGTAPALMTSASVSAYALGIAIPIPGASGSGKGDTTGSVDNVSLGTFKVLGKIFVIAGTASGEGAGCDGQILIVLDDVDALFTLLGGGGLALAILMLGAILFAGRNGGCLSKVLCTVFGGLGAIGLGLSLEQFQVISPTSPVGLVIVIVGSVLGFLLAARLGLSGNPLPTSTPAGPPPTTPPPPPPPTLAPPATDPPATDDASEGAADLLGNVALDDAARAKAAAAGSSGAAGNAGAGPSPSPAPAPEPPPDEASEGAADLLGNIALDDAARAKAAAAGSSGATGSTGSPTDKPMDFYDAAKTAADILDAGPPPAPGPTPPENPNAPGVDVKE